MGASLCLTPIAHASEVASWNGPYLMVLSTNAKSGTSIAAGQNEPAHRTNVSLSSSCNAGAMMRATGTANSGRVRSSP